MPTQKTIVITRFDPDKDEGDREFTFEVGFRWFF